jgi:predicted nucleotidyltransferase
VTQTTETFLPPLGTDGDLPRGIYRITLQQVLDRFGKGSRQRIAVGQRLERIHRIAVATGQVARFVVFGSFVTAKRDPADVDVFLLMENTFDMGQLAGEARVLFDHASAQAHFGASVFWLRRLAALGGEEQAIAGWQVKRDGTFRGIVEIVEEQI